MLSVGRAEKIVPREMTIRKSTPKGGLRRLIKVVVIGFGLVFKGRVPCSSGKRERQGKRGGEPP